MLAYKGFNIGYVCRGYQFDKEKVNRTDRAKCVRDGFHAALNPLDCFSYYPDPSHAVYCLVECSGDIHEDCSDTKIACTELRIVKELSMREMMIHAIAYMEKHKEEFICNQLIIRQITFISICLCLFFQLIFH